MGAGKRAQRPEFFFTSDSSQQANLDLDLTCQFSFFIPPLSILFTFISRREVNEQTSPENNEIISFAETGRDEFANAVLIEGGDPLSDVLREISDPDLASRLHHISTFDPVVLLLANKTATTIDCSTNINLHRS